MLYITSCILLPPASARAAIPENWNLPEPGRAEEVSLSLGASTARDVVPPFRAGERHRSSLLAAATWRLTRAPGDPFPPEAGPPKGGNPRDEVLFDLQAEFLRDAWPDGDSLSGPGDLQLGALATHTRLRGPGREGLGFSWGFRVKLPNARDQGELGTDETDVVLLGGLAGALGPIDGSLLGGLAILGNPLRYTDQDDVPFVSLGVRWDGARLPVNLVPKGRISRAFRTTRNPPRGEASLGFEAGDRWWVEVEGGVGLDPASAASRVQVGLGWRR
jgi:hypothetical protein